MNTGPLNLVAPLKEGLSGIEHIFWMHVFVEKPPACRNAFAILTAIEKAMRPLKSSEWELRRTHESQPMRIKNHHSNKDEPTMLFLWYGRVKDRNSGQGPGVYVGGLRQRGTHERA